MKNTTYYLYNTNAGRGIICTDGERYYDCAIDNNGRDEISGLDIYAENALADLRNAYGSIDGLYTLDDCISEFDSEKIYLFDEKDFDTLEKIVVIN